MEDEKRSASLLRGMLTEYCPDVEVAGEAGSVKTAAETISTASPLLVFLDIEMPDGTAFDLLEQISEKKFHIIFTTAYDHYALRAIKFSALDYLLKPVSITELKAAVDKVRSKQMDTTMLNNLNILMQNLPVNGKKGSKIALPTLDGHIFADCDDIVRLEAEGNYSNVFLINGDRIMVSRTLKDLEGFISEDDFIRVHHSHIINIRHVKEYVKGSGGYVIMKDGSKAEVAVRKKEEFFKKMRIH